MSGPETGKVYLLGGGTGDIELLTLKGARLLAMADVIIYDRLVNPLFLFLAKKEASFIYCGKLPTDHRLSQSQIEAELIQQAMIGQQVVRLKGGDPAIFGRVAEEMVALERAGIDYEVIPGVTAASVASIYAGIPLTDRELCRHVTLATAHGQKDSPIDVSQLATGGTLAFYMGVANLPTICQNLMAVGQTGDTPIAVITWGSYGRQRVVIGTLGTILEKEISNPAMIIVGQVVKHRQKSSWFERLPYFGRKLLLVGQGPIDWQTISAYTAKGADVWAMEVGPRDQRFDEVSRRYLSEHQWHEIIYLDDYPETPSLLAETFKAIGLEKAFMRLKDDNSSKEKWREVNGSI
ncbi:uroporphyrinogen-III C-methyltransferase [Vagococcus sp. BWB3-3]|uniref:Uroporphyrinogen-III C-methyltransferase n=1 Tax=Vagococcus allomyrinae TaxID=2794353 RepID=A0A940PHF6_9ENTE|nr:uroporphyrinogen-III C-methyltransferase [Vagococcus allomyrinae]MBP1042998.1 uroporphyrinogen-III C-methyltransferase [Vagococcus allomyrinae]